MLNYECKIKGLALGIAITASVSALLSPACGLCQQAELTFADYRDLVKKDATIVVGGNAAQDVLEGASTMAARLKELTGNGPIVNLDVEVPPEDKPVCNLILLGIPNSNHVLVEGYDITDATKVTVEYPGKNKGILEILTSPWSKDKALLIIAGSDQWGTKAAVDASAGSQESQKLQELDGHKGTAEWGERRGPTSPFVSKIGATLALLLTLRGGEQIPEEMKEIVKRDTVSVSIRFTHELSASEVRSIEELGLEFKRLPNGEMAHSGTIYGAEVPWDKVDDLAELEAVVRIESGWQLGVEDPVSQGQR